MPSVEEKVVKLSMDEKELDKSTKKAINDLDDLKKALLFEDAGKGLEAVSKAAAKVDMEPLSQGIAGVTSQFNILNTAGAAAIFNITNRAIDAGEGLIKALSVDQINAGWDKFADKTSAVQTIMSATSNQFEDTGKQMEYVEGQLEKLNWFTDETSYRFLDMVNNIGKFTSGNIALDKSVDAMQGIAVWAARSGAGVEGAGRAMYNLSQSMAMGALRLEDWMSIENANMATYEFKKTALDTAVSVGTLTKKADGLYQTLDGTAVSIEGFRETLQEKWLTSDVLIKTLETYGRFATELNQFYEELEGNVPTTTLIGFIDDYIDGTLDMSEAMRLTGKDAEWLSERIGTLASDEYKLGRESFKAAQETKTFQEAIDYVKESVSSGWMRTFEYLFGNYQEAKEFFSSMSEWLYDIFVASGDARNALLALWKDEGGRDIFIDGLYQIMDNISTILTTVKDAWYDVFPEATVDDLMNITEGFRNWIDILTPTEDTLDTLGSLVRMVATGLQTLHRIVRTGAQAIYPYLLVLNRLAGVAMNVVGALADFSTRLMNLIFPSDGLDEFGNSLMETNSIIAYILDGGIDVLVELLAVLFNSFDTFVSYVEEHGGGVSGILAGLAAAFQALADGLFNMESLNGLMERAFGGVGAIFQGLIQTVQMAISEIFGIDFEEGSGMTDWLAGVSENLDGLDIPGKLEAIVLGIGGVTGALLQFAADLLGVDSDVRGVINNLVADLGAVFHWLVEQIQNLTITDIKNIGLVVTLAYIAKSLGDLLKGLKGGVGELTKLFKQVRGLLDTAADESITQRLSDVFGKTKWLQIAVAIGLLVGGLLQLATVPADDLYKGVLAIVVVLGMLLGAMKIMQKITEGMPKKELDNFIAIMTGFGIAVGLIGLAVASIAKVGDGFAVTGALGAIGSILIMLGVFAKAMSSMDTGAIAKAAGGVALLSLSITTMIPAVAIFGKMDPGNLTAGILAVAGLMTAFGVFGKLMGKADWKPLLASVPVIMAFSGALLALDVVLGGMMGMIALSEEKFNAASGTLIAMIAFFGGAIAVMAAAAKGSTASELLALSATMISFAAGIEILTIALGQIGAMDPNALLRSGITIAAGIALITVALVALMAAAKKFAAGQSTLIALAGVILSVAAAIAAVGVAAAGIGAASYLITASFTMLIEAGEKFGDKLPEYVNKAMDGVQVAILRLLEIVALAATPLFTAALVLFSAFVKALTAIIPDVVAGVMLLATELLEVIGELADPLLQALVDVVNAITDNLTPLMNALDDLLAAIFYHLALSLRNLLGDFVGFFYTLVTGKDFREDLAGAMSEGFVPAMAKGIADARKGAEGSIKTEMTEAGEDATEAFADGAEQTSEETLPETGSGMVDDVVSGVDSNVGKAEASGNRIGNAIGKGMADGVNGWTEYINSLGLFNLGGKRTDNAAPEDSDGTYVSPGITEAIERHEKWKKEQEEAAFESGVDIGDAYTTGLGESIASSKAPSAGARSQAQKIDDAFKDELSKLDTADKTAEALLKLWKAQNPNASDADIAVKEMELLAGQIETQSARAQISQMQYTETLQKMGESASETHEAYLKMIEDQTKLLELQNEMNQNQLQGHEATAEAFQRMNDIMHDYYYNENNGRTMAEYLKSLGFTDREIAEAAAKEAGYAIPKIVEETKDATVEATMNAGEQTVQLYAESVTTNLEGLTPTFTGFGNTYATSLGTGMTDMTDNVGTAAVTMVDTAREQASSEEMIEKWTDVGYQFDMGIIKGLERGEGELYAAVERIVRAALARAKAAAGVASPSKETMYQASMWVAGYVKGLNDNGDDVSKAIVKPIKAAMNASENIFTDSSTEGFNKSFLNGMNQSANMLAQKVHNLSEVTADEMDKFKNEVDLKGLFDGLLDEDEIHVQVVLDLDDTAVQGLSAKNLPMTTYPNPIDQNSLAMLSQQIQNESNRISAIEARMNLEKSSGGDSGSQMENQAQAPVINMTQNNYSPKALTRLEIRRDTERMVSTMANKLNVPRKR